MSTAPGSRHDTVHHVDHVIVGAGFGGLCAAIKLQEDGESDFVVLEKGADVGGTWRDNTYPGATCDIPSQLYSFSFSAFDWPSSYSPQRDIQAYIKQVADESGTLDRFVFDTLVEDAAWDDESQRWTVRTQQRHLGLAHPRRGRRRPLGAQAPRHRGDRHLPGRRLPLRAVEPRRRPHRQARGRDRHRRLGHPDRPGAPEDREPPRRLPAHRAVDHPAQRPALRTARARRAAPGPRAAEALPHRPLLGARGLRAGVHPPAQARRTRAEGRPRQHPEGHQGPGGCRRRSRRTSRSGASGCSAPTPTTRPSTPTTPSW